MSKKDAGGGKEKELQTLYAELNKVKNSEEYEKAVKVCNKILNVAPNDSLAFHCKIVAMVHCGKFDDALKQIENGKFQLDLSFEAAYCHYRNNKPEQALQIIQQVASPKAKHRELLAQILYRLERYQECYNVYKDMIKNISDDQEVERMTNLTAVTANIADKSLFVGEQQDSYEQRYNTGCNLAAVGDYVGSENALKGAVEAAKSYLAEEEEAGEDEIEEETGIIKVQLGYVLQKQGKEKEAQTIYNQVLRNKPSDIGLVAVASNNLLTLNKDQNIFDSKKRIKAATVDGLENRLNSRQRKGISRNNALLAMYTAQVDLCQQLVENLDDDQDKEFIIAGALARAGKHQAAVERLLEEASGDPVRKVTAAQILLTAGEVAAATQQLEQLSPDWKYRTGMVSTLVTLLLALDNREAAARLLKSAVEWNKKSGRVKNDDQDMAIVWRKTAEFHLNTGEPKVAAASLEELLQLETENTATLAQLVLAYAKFDLEKALAASKRLPPFEQGSVDVNSLEAPGWLGPRNTKKTPKAGSAPSPKAEVDGEVKKKRIRKRKKRLPKNYNPNVDPDPERWVPRRERTGLRYMPGGYRKPRKDRRKKEVFTGAQGAAGQDTAESFDYSAKAAAKAESAAAAAAASPVADAPAAKVPPRQQKGKAQNKSKKKGGKKQF